MKKILILAAMSLPLASCASVSNKHEVVAESTELSDIKEIVTDESVNNDKPVRCHEPTGYDNQPIPLDTGVLREAPIDVIPKELFIERLEASSLWSKVSHVNSFKSDFSLSEINGFLQIRGDGSFSKSEDITKVTYSPLNVNKRKKYGHQLLDQEKFGMTETVNLVINDHDKADAILDQLYQQYSVKVENNDVLSDGETLHSYVRYNGILFELWGLSRNTHPLEVCNFNMLTTLTVS